MQAHTEFICLHIKPLYWEAVKCDIFVYDIISGFLREKSQVFSGEFYVHFCRAKITPHYIFQQAIIIWNCLSLEAKAWWERREPYIYHRKEKKSWSFSYFWWPLEILYIVHLQGRRERAKTNQPLDYCATKWELQLETWAWHCDCTSVYLFRQALG